jgi:hypothetical protein
VFTPMPSTSSSDGAHASIMQLKSRIRSHGCCGASPKISTMRRGW